MSRYILIRRLRGPVLILLVGVLALLHQMNIIEHFWHLFWPLMLIAFGVLLLAERAALSAEGGYPPQVPGMPYPGAPNPAYDPARPFPGGVDPSATTESSIVTTRPHPFGDDPDGGKS
jgi:hypothetical protein